MALRGGCLLCIIIVSMIMLIEAQDLDLYHILMPCPEMLAPVNGHIKSSTKQEVTIACNPRFKLVGTNTRKCIRGHWFPPGIPSCMPFAACTTRPVVLHGRVQYKTDSAPYPKPRGSIATVVCEEGYSSFDTFQSRFEIECDGFESWSRVNGGLGISCTEMHCQNPPNVPRATYRFVPRTPSSEITLLQVEYVCNDSYVLVDPSISTKLTCHNGQWEGSIPTCVPRSTVCVTPGTFHNGTWKVKESPARSDDSLRVGAEIEYKCNPGYKLVGHSVLMCLPNGLWTNLVPECVPDWEPVYYCQPLPKIQNGRCLCADMKGSSDLSFCMPFHPGSRVECSCRQGFTLQGSSILTCRSNAKFNNPMPTCVGSFDESPGLMEIPPYHMDSGRPYNSADITDGKNKVSSLVIVVTTACSVLGVLLIIMAVMVFRRHKPHLRGMAGVSSAGPHLFQQGPSSPPYARVHNSSMDEHDRLALMAYVEASRVHLPTYEEATRLGTDDSNVSCVPGRMAAGGPPFDYCGNNPSASVPPNPHFYLQNRQYSASHSRPGIASTDSASSGLSNPLSSALATGGMNSGLNGNSSLTTHRLDGVSVSEMFGSIDTVNVSMSDASTSVTVETYDSSTCGRSVGSSSQQATAGSLQSSRDQLADEDAPLLDSTSQRDNDVVSMSSNPSHSSKEEQ